MAMVVLPSTQRARCGQPQALCQARRCYAQRGGGCKPTSRRGCAAIAAALHTRVSCTTDVSTRATFARPRSGSDNAGMSPRRVVAHAARASTRRHPRIDSTASCNCEYLTAQLGGAFEVEVDD